MREKRQTVIRRTPEGRYVVTCRICPNRFLRQLRPGERVGVAFDTAREAEDQGSRHRQSVTHQDAVVRLARNVPSDEEIVFARIFGGPEPMPCSECGYFHSQKLSCLVAARVRDREGL